MTDDHGDQFPGAVPATTAPAARQAGAEERLVRMSAASSASGRRTPTHGAGGRPTTTMGRMGRLTRRSLGRFDRYTLDVFNPRPPHAQPDHSA